MVPKQNHYLPFLVLLLAFLSCFSGVQAQEEQQQVQEEAQKLQIGGFLEADHISYFKNAGGKINSRNQAILQLEIKSQLKKNISFFASVELRDDVSDQLRSRIFLDEGYLHYAHQNFDLRLGKQIISWGAADGINPTNNINPVDFTDLLDTDDEHIGVFSIKADYYLKNWTLEGILVPVFTPSVLPVNGYTAPGRNRWNLALPAVIPDAGEPSGFFKASYALAAAQLPPRDWRSAQIAGKLVHSYQGWDFSLSYYHGWDDLSTFRFHPQLVTRDSLHIGIQPEFYKLHVPGFDFSTTMGKYGLRGEAAYFSTPDKRGTDPAITDPFYMYVIGVDRNFGKVLGDNNLFVIVQWIQQFIQTGAHIPNTSLNNVFQRALMTRMEYAPNSFATFTVQTIYDFKSDNYFIRPEFEYQLSDGINIGVLSDIMDGPDNTFSGNFRHNKRLQVRLKYNF
jgi:hypothetical protein